MPAAGMHRLAMACLVAERTSGTIGWAARFDRRSVEITF